ncbi:hypothetical protein O181_054979 [Austropuccinia psidii MF-1]|uniref:Uncharacterized protein n=1 Tax=Austropuccinia psidii MF-1 TaxID=1389203 RepID=A0A9Q3E5K2_9BASI|nr:hypothetical protein [Austropuccinia psidii MF-1]
MRQAKHAAKVLTRDLTRKGTPIKTKTSSDPVDSTHLAVSGWLWPGGGGQALIHPQFWIEFCSNHQKNQLRQHVSTSGRHRAMGAANAASISPISGSSHPSQGQA